MALAGQFIDFYLPYSNEKGTISPLKQAEMILRKGRELVENKQKNIAILYSANYGQTRRIQEIYLGGGWRTHTNGSNQAAVINSVESSLDNIDNCDLKEKLRILPITTMNAYENPVHPWNEDILLGIVTTDLDRIKAYLNSGWIVLGWQNQNTVGTSHPYAIGGGISQLPPKISKKIQETLAILAAQYQER